MEKYKYGIKFRLEKRRENPKDKESKLITTNLPINADITFNGMRIFYFTGHRIDAEKWIDKVVDGVRVQQVKKNNFNLKGESASEINARLRRIKIAVEDVFNRLDVNGIPPTKNNVRDELKKELDEETMSRKTLLEYYQMLVDLREKELKDTPNRAQWKKGTLTKHKTMIRHLEGFKRQLYFEDVTEELLSKFESYLIGKNLSNSYVHKSMKDIKTFLNWATQMGYNRVLTYQNYQQKFKDESASNNTNLFALTNEELKTLQRLEISRRALDRTRDMFLFCCFTGLRFSDVYKLEWKDIADGRIDIVTQKTNQHIKIPMNKTLQKIVAKYPKLEKRVFPSISNQKYNDQLKELGKIAGFNEEWVKVKQCGNTVTREKSPKYEFMSSHVARRTFVTYALRSGWQPEVIRAITGHTTSKMMMNYVKMDMDAKQEFMNLLDHDEIEETVFDYDITDEERKTLDIPVKDEYLENISHNRELAISHLGMLFQRRGDIEKSVDCMNQLPKSEQVKFMQALISMKFQGLKDGKSK
ncbi:site-specific integrase [Bacteroides sp. 214]|uniref:site-specific integrase n=1 Tax=Bacteroides sp. 214 TaxID=2302935 RepID=UPI0013D62A46|nr:site-specific integrase [Bacteroides sp. 214]NDW11973.1 site-specific integrase [Bacteroides sp. 214]